MRGSEHVSARVLTGLGLAFGAAYLVWRASASLDGAPGWLAVPFLLVEVVAFVGTALLAWALWPGATGAPADDGQGVTPADAPYRPIDVVVRVDQQLEHEVRATLLALRSVVGVDSVVVVDHSARPAVASLATEFQAVYAATDPADGNGLEVVRAAVRTPEFLLLDAGDVPTSDILGRLVPFLADDRVAVVQGLGVSLADDSPEHGPNRRHELTFERASMAPALGGRGTALWSGSGALVRTAALADVEVDDRPLVEACWRASAQLMRSGWRVVAPNEVPVVGFRTVTCDRAVYVDRVRRTRAARHLLLGRDGVLRIGGYTPVQRLSIAAWAVRPMSSFRRAVFLAVLCASMLAGKVPFSASWLTLLGLWLPYFLYAPAGLSMLSGWSLRPGDRTRWSLHNIGATLTSLRSEPRGRRRHRQPIVNLPSSQYGASLVVAIVVLSIVLLLRGLSDRFTHTMGSLPQPALVALLVVSLWLLAISLDLLRVLARRAQSRRASRVIAALSATLGERSVTVLDLTALGAGVLSHTGLDVGEQMLLETAVPTATGVTSMRVPVTVRNVSALATGEWRIGLEFGAMDDATANALAEYCTIEPMWEQMGVVPDRSITEARPIAPAVLTEAVAPAAGRMALRLVSLLALVGAIASSLPTTVEASSQLDHRFTGRVLDGDGNGVKGAVVTAVCASDRGADRRWGTGDDVYSSPVAVVSDAEGRFFATMFGSACWSFVAPPVGYATIDSLPGEPTGLDLATGDAYRTIRLEPSDGAPLTRVRGTLRQMMWSDLDGDGMRDAGEPGVAGVRVTLLDDDGHAVATATTAHTGVTVFNSVPAGHYRVAIANVPSGSVLSPIAPDQAGMRGSDVDPVTGRSPLVQVADDLAAIEFSAGVRAQTGASASMRTATVLPSPTDEMLGISNDLQHTMSLVVLFLVGIIAVSLLVGLARPRRIAFVRV